MRKKTEKTPEKKYSSSQLALLIVQYLLVKTGQLPIYIANLFIIAFKHISSLKVYLWFVRSSFKAVSRSFPHFFKVLPLQKPKQKKIRPFNLKKAILKLFFKINFKRFKINFPQIKKPNIFKLAPKRAITTYRSNRQSLWHIWHKLYLRVIKKKVNLIRHIDPLESLLHFRLITNIKRGRPKNKKPFIPRISKKKAIISLAILTIFFSSYTWMVITLTSAIPSPSRIYQNNRPYTTEIYDRKGRLLYKVYENKNRSFVKLEDIPQNLINATIAVEDKNFYHHLGIDFGAVIRALYHNYQNNSQEGASTITQQLIKNTLLTSEKTYSRKTKEAVLALLTERLYSKKQILEMYFNEAPYGGPLWGIKAASQSYFGKEPKDLNLAECTFLAGLPASPTEFSPYGITPELGTERQKQVLKRMVEDRYITETEAGEALTQKLTFKPQIDEIQAPHFVFYVKDLLVKKYGPRLVSEGGLKIITTLDLDLQKQSEEILRTEVDALSSLNVKNGAAMITDPRNGQILVMVGSKDYFASDFGNFNVTLALRQPGSSIKPITYATAFKKGFAPGNTILDIPTTFKNQWESYSPVNYDGSFHGPVSIRVALASSLNVPAVKALASVGMDSMIKTAKDLGITTFNDPKSYGLSLTLGAGDVKMIDMMSVYGVFSQQGVRQELNPILKITDSSGNVLEDFENKQEQESSGKQVLEPEVAYLISNILSDNNARTLAFGPKSLLNVSSGVAVKTGTTDNKRDNWTFGYSPDFVVGVWVGNPDNSPMNQRLTSGVTGAAPIWNKLTKLMLDKYPNPQFKRPEKIVEGIVDGRRDLVISGATPKNLAKTVKKDDKFFYSDSFSSFATSSGQTVTEADKNQSQN